MQSRDLLVLVIGTTLYKSCATQSLRSFALLLPGILLSLPVVLILLLIGRA